MLSQWVITENLYLNFTKWYKNGNSSSILLRCAAVHYLSTAWSNYSNCTVNSSKYFGNEDMHPSSSPSMLNLLLWSGPNANINAYDQYRIRIRPGNLKNQVRTLNPDKKWSCWPDPVSTLMGCYCKIDDSNRHSEERLIHGWTDITMLGIHVVTI